jgi:hypothetical protein
VNAGAADSAVREAFKRMVESARALVRVADEFENDPAACGEHTDGHVAAVERYVAADTAWADAQGDGAPILPPFEG